MEDRELQIELFTLALREAVERLRTLACETYTKLSAEGDRVQLKCCVYPLKTDENGDNYPNLVVFRINAGLMKTECSSWLIRPYVRVSADCYPMHHLLDVRTFQGEMNIEVNGIDFGKGKFNLNEGE